MSHSRCHRQWPASGRTRGFTLIEVLVTIAIAAIAAALALPSYREFSIRMTVSSNVNSLVGALNTARSEAVKRGRRVAVIANGGNWSNGWQIIAGKATAAGTVADPVTPGATEAACQGDLDLDGVTQLCARFDAALPDTYTVLGNVTGTGTDDMIMFGAAGNLVGGATAFDFNVCRPSTAADSTQSRRINVAQSGIITTYRDTTSSPAGTCG